MRWIFALVLALSFPAYSWAESLPPDFSSSLRVDPALGLQTPADIARRLLSLSMELSSEAAAQSTELRKLSTSLEESRSALESCTRSLEEARSLLLARSAELWLWRGATALSVIGCASALAWGLSR